MECPKCKHSYNDSDNIPRILIKCGHTLCQECIKSLFLESSIICPECKIKNEAPSISSFPKNLALIHMSVATPNEESKISETRVKVASKSGNGKKEKGEGKRQRHMHKICPTHRKKEEAYCEDCYCLLCIDCILIDGHKTHQILSITEVSNEGE